MAQLNNYEATKILRNKGIKTPIIALTAGAMKGDEAKCIEASCDDYLTKPIDRKKLFETLGKYLPARDSEKEIQKMAYMFVQHSVQDYEAWKSVFDSVGDLRRRSGEKSYQILRQDNDSNSLIALFQWDNLDNARKYAASPELKAAMERAGVTGKPEISFLKEAARG